MTVTEQYRLEQENRRLEIKLTERMNRINERNMEIYNLKKKLEHRESQMKEIDPSKIKLDKLEKWYAKCNIDIPELEEIFVEKKQ